MQTDQLIDGLVADAGSRPMRRRPAWFAIAGGGAVLAGVAFWLSIGPRPDIEAAAQTVRFLFKFALAGALIVATIHALRALARPTGDRRVLWPILLPAAALAVGVCLELAMVSPSLWAERLVGDNSSICLVAIPMLGAIPLALFLVTLRRQAPAHPMLAGGLAGLSAAAIAAFFYAAHCTDDSPLFVATWYPLASLILVAAGALIGRRLLRW